MAILLLQLLFLLGLLDSSSSFSLIGCRDGVTTTIRQFQKRDAAAVAVLFHDTVRTVNLGDYSLSQVQAWAPSNLFFRDWAEVCSSNDRFTIVAQMKDDDNEEEEEEGGEIAGFAELEVNGHIDCFYIQREHQRQGIGRQLYEAIEKQAMSDGHHCLFVEASITAKPFFEQMGFVTLKEKTVSCRGESFINYKMEKQLKEEEES